eukprot:CAMPEP_0170516306 /NCGR_PEP_ID=MMETSP0209-20121228/2552_1 /TAXON_ID=665100 ORGANISM="Litonotus pictus, Strain P1" /NCGR_SAMPLE_ID=MMETSP0209 /ASSEMBLY_ACC=CAM_ASM_000301 /LENGTH=300 /DNA_ID=CAMNT_0010801131 /DNA_START=114 /DNA_END=1016 /DNA_ORIENTATION=+
MDEEMEIIFNDCDFGNNVVLKCDLKVDDSGIIKITANKYLLSSIPAQLRIPDGYEGFKVGVSFAYIQSVEYNESESLLSISANFDSTIVLLKIKIRQGAINSSSAVSSFSQRIKDEADYIKSVANTVKSNLSKLVSRAVADQETIDSQSDEYSSAQSQIDEINNKISSLAEEISSKQIELDLNKQSIEEYNTTIGKLETDLRVVKADKNVCEREKKTLEETKKRLDEFKDKYSEENEYATFNEKYKKQCVFLTAADELTKYIPNQRVNVHNVVIKVTKDNNFDHAKDYFSGRELFINMRN